jgi:Fe-S oxidoreductase
VDLVEMPRTMERSYCCGAGGGRIWMQEAHMKERPAESRIREAVALGVDTFVVACPKDISMFKDAVKTTGNEGKIVVKDVTEMVYEGVLYEVKPNA